jgi:hypothetical protein
LSGEGSGVFFEENGSEFSKIPGPRMIVPDLSIADRIDVLLDAEVAEALVSEDKIERRTAEAFAQVRRTPREVSVQFSGGITQRCWSVSKGDGTYRVVYLPSAGYFSLCVESDFGPLDIGVHGPALGCFGSV